MLRRRKRDVVADLPDKSVRVTPVDLEPKMAELYRRCELAVAASIADSDLGPLSAMVSHQRSLFEPYDDDGDGAHAAEADLLLGDIARGDATASTARRVDAAVEAMSPAARVVFLRNLVVAAKLPAVLGRIQDWLDSSDTDRKLVVFAHHRQIVRAIADRFDAVTLLPSMSEHRRGDAVHQFNNNTAPRVMVCAVTDATPELRLQPRASDVIFVEQPWAPAECDMAEDQCHNTGEQRGHMVEYVVAGDTIDEHIAVLVERRRSAAGAAMEGGDWDTILRSAVRRWMRGRCEPPELASARPQPELRLEPPSAP